MEAGVGANKFGLCLEPATAFRLNLLEFVEGRKGPIRQGFIGERPEPFTGLQLG